MPEKRISEIQNLIGESRQTVAGLTVEAGKVAEFARAIGSHNPVFYDRDAARSAGYDDIPAPLTFTRVAYFSRYRVGDVNSSFGFDLGFDSERTIHGEQEYEYERHLLVGDTIDGITRLNDVYQKESSNGRTLTFAILETDYTDQNGNLVLTERRTRIERGSGEK